MRAALSSNPFAAAHARFARFSHPHACGDRYGPFCTYPYIPRPAGEYGALWYGTDERATHFLSNTRVYNCRYAFSSLHAARLKRKGKPVFQLRGAVYYRVAPAMIPPGGLAPDYAQLYTLDADARSPRAL